MGTGRRDGENRGPGESNHRTSRNSQDRVPDTAFLDSRDSVPDTALLLFSGFGSVCAILQFVVPGVQFCNSATGFGKICCILEVNIWTFARSFTKKKTESQP